MKMNIQEANEETLDTSELLGLLDFDDDMWYLIIDELIDLINRSKFKLHLNLLNLLNIKQSFKIGIGVKQIINLTEC